MTDNGIDTDRWIPLCLKNPIKQLVIIVCHNYYFYVSQSVLNLLCNLSHLIHITHLWDRCIIILIFLDREKGLEQNVLESLYNLSGLGSQNYKQSR